MAVDMELLVSEVTKRVTTMMTKEISRCFTAMSQQHLVNIATTVSELPVLTRLSDEIAVIAKQVTESSDEIAVITKQVTESSDEIAVIAKQVTESSNEIAVIAKTISDSPTGSSRRSSLLSDEGHCSAHDTDGSPCVERAQIGYCDRHTCSGKTKQGRRCKRKASKESSYCKSHQTSSTHGSQRTPKTPSAPRRSIDLSISPSSSPKSCTAPTAIFGTDGTSTERRIPNAIFGIMGRSGTDVSRLAAPPSKPPPVAAHVPEVKALSRNELVRSRFVSSTDMHDFDRISMEEAGDRTIIVRSLSLDDMKVVRFSDLDNLDAADLDNQYHVFVDGDLVKRHVKIWDYIKDIELIGNIFREQDQE